jgi:hypothetical protein
MAERLMQQRFDWTNNSASEEIILAISGLSQISIVPDDLVLAHLKNLQTTILQTVLNQKAGTLPLDERMVPLREIDVVTMETHGLTRGNSILDQHHATFKECGNWSDIYNFGQARWSIHMLKPRYQERNMRLVCVERQGNDEEPFKYNVGFIKEDELRMLVRELAL